MSGKILLTVGLTWLGAVVLWLRSAQSFSFGLELGRGKGAIVLGYILAYLIQLLIFGWIIPLALGVYRYQKSLQFKKIYRPYRTTVNKTCSCNNSRITFPTP